MPVVLIQNVMLNTSIMITKKQRIKFHHWSWVLVVFIFLSGINPVFAEGSKDLYPQGVQGGRAYLRASTASSAAFPFPNLATHYVFAEAGERIALASSAQTGTNNRIRLYGPNSAQITLSFPNGTGNIPNRTGELAGPLLPGQTGGNRYNPIYHQVTQTGIYKVEFISTSGSEIGDNRIGYVAANANWSQPNNSNYLAAWDISVAKQSGSTWSWKEGRVYTTVVNMDNPSYGGSSGSDNNNFRPNSGFYGNFKVLTRDGYVYNVDNNGNQGISFTFMVNNRGFHAPGIPDVPLYKSIDAPNEQHVRDRYHDPRSEDSGAAVSQKIFYNFPDFNMPETSIGAVPGGNTWLRIEEKNLNVDVITIEGVEGSPNQLGNKGAYVKFFNESGGDYYITIKPKANSNLNFPERLVTGSSVVGNNVIWWDGKDGNGVSLPSGTAEVEIELKLRGAEVHFPYIDMELNHNGIILELLSQDLNSVRSDKVFWNDSDIRTINTGTFGSMTNPRNASHNVFPNGTSSNTNGHIWGLGSNRTIGTFGDEQGMDTWTFIEGDAIFADFEINVKEADLEIPSVTPSKSYLTVGDEVTYYIKAVNNGPSDVEAAPFSFIIPEGFDPKSISFNGNGCGSENATLTYNPSTRTYSSLLDLPDGCVIYYTITLDVGTTIIPGQHDFTATIMRPNDVTDPDATNPDPAIPPTDPFYECDNNGILEDCNNIKTVTAQFDILGLCYEFVQGESFTWSYPTSTQTTITQSLTQPGTNAGFVFDIYELDNSFNMNINGILITTQEIQFQKSGGLTQNIRFADGTIWENGVIQDIWKLRGETNKPIVRVEISSLGAISIYGSKVSSSSPTYSLEPLELFEGNSFNAIVWNENEPNTIIVTQNVIGATLMDGYGSGQNIVPCETYTLEKEGVFNDENGDNASQPGETISYTLTVKNAGDLDIYDLELTDPMLGGLISSAYTGDDNNDGVLNKTEEWVYLLTYTITQADIVQKGVYNLAMVKGKNVLNEDLDPETSIDPTPLDPSDPMYEPTKPNHTFVALKGRSLLITNPNIYQKVKRN
jgi:uncharacterized repeat protein (TIGR01451 family)